MFPFPGRPDLLNRPDLHYGITTVGVPTTAIVDTGDCVILVSATTTITLPLAANHQGAAVYVKNIGAGATVTIARTAPDTIDGATSKTLGAQWDSMLLVSDGTEWFILAVQP